MKTWRELVAAARTRGRFTSYERSMASQWLTCAVGEQHRALPSVVVYGLGVHHGPIDEALHDLGNSMSYASPGFILAVGECDFDACDRILDAIEDRVLQLKREVGS